LASRLSAKNNKDSTTDIGREKRWKTIITII
jgi:hypothetical protein